MQIISFLSRLLAVFAAILLFVFVLGPIAAETVEIEPTQPTDPSEERTEGGEIDLQQVDRLIQDYFAEGAASALPSPLALTTDTAQWLDDLKPNAPATDAQHLWWALLCLHHHDYARCRQALSKTQDSRESADISLPLKVALWQRDPPPPPTIEQQQAIYSRSDILATWLNTDPRLAVERAAWLSRHLTYDQNYERIINAIYKNLTNDELLRQDPAQALDLTMQWLSKDPSPCMRLERLRDRIPNYMLKPVDGRIGGLSPDSATLWTAISPIVPSDASLGRQTALLVLSSGSFLFSWSRGDGLRPIEDFLDNLQQIPDGQRDTARLLAQASWLSSYYYKKINIDDQRAKKAAEWQKAWQLRALSDAHLNPAARVGLVAFFVDEEALARERHHDIWLVDEEVAYLGLDALQATWPQLPADESAIAVRHEPGTLSVLLAIDSLPRNVQWQTRVNALLDVVGDQGLLYESSHEYAFTKERQKLRTATTFSDDRRYRSKSEHDPAAISRLLLVWAAELQRDSLFNSLLARSGSDAANGIGLYYRLVTCGRTDLAHQLLAQRSADLTLREQPFIRQKQHEPLLNAWLESITDEDKRLIVKFAWSTMPIVGYLHGQWRKWPGAEISPNKADDSSAFKATTDEIFKHNFTDPEVEKQLAWLMAKWPQLAGEHFNEVIRKEWQAFINGDPSIADRPAVDYLRYAYIMGMRSFLYGDFAMLRQSQEFFRDNENTASLNASFMLGTDHAWKNPLLWSHWDQADMQRLYKYYSKQLRYRAAHSTTPKIFDLLPSQVFALALACDDVAGAAQLFQEAEQARPPEKPLQIVLSGQSMAQTLAGYIRHHSDTDEERERILRLGLATKDTIGWNGGSHKKLLRKLVSYQIIQAQEILTWGKWIAPYGIKPGRDISGIIRDLIKDLYRDEPNEQQVSERRQLIEGLFDFAEQLCEQDKDNKGKRGLGKLRKELAEALQSKEKPRQKEMDQADEDDTEATGEAGPQSFDMF